MTITLAPDGPLDVGATLARYRLWGEDPANRFGGDVFRRVLRRPGVLAPYDVRWQGPVDAVRLTVTVTGIRSAGARDAVVREVRAIFGLDFDLGGFYRFAKEDVVLAPLVEVFHGLRPTLAPTALEMLVGAITAQQVNLAFAFALRARLVRRYGVPVATGGDVVYAFPDAAALARARIASLRALQFSTAKALAVRGVARAVAAGLEAESLAPLSNTAVIERLTALRGVGRWTAEWFLARCLGRGDVCPAGDLGVRKAFAHFCGRGRMPSEESVRRRAAVWGPYQNLAVHYLLAGLRRATERGGGGS
jgi:DNA-3-methyladenine glycosylase II